MEKFRDFEGGLGTRWFRGLWVFLVWSRVGIVMRVRVLKKDRWTVEVLGRMVMRG